MTSRTGSDKDISGDVSSELFDRPVTESATAWAERDSHGPSDEYWIKIGRPVWEAMRGMARNIANISGYDYSDVVKQIDRKSAMEWAENNARPVEQGAGCQVPDCQCDGRIEIMEWGPEDMTETDDSDYAVQPMTVADDDIPKPRDQPVDRGRGSITGSDVNMSSDEESNLCDRPVMESETVWDSQDFQDPSDMEYWGNVNLQAMQAMREMTGGDS